MRVLVGVEYQRQGRLALDGVIPPWTVGDRLRKALIYSETSPSAMAKALGVDPRTVTNYTNGTTKRVPRSVIIVWAQVTGVDPVWLETGTPPTGEITGPGVQ